jgi:hypothetical protein
MTGANRQVTKRAQEAACDPLNQPWEAANMGFFASGADESRILAVNSVYFALYTTSALVHFLIIDN